MFSYEKNPRVVCEAERKGHKELCVPKVMSEGCYKHVVKDLNICFIWKQTSKPQKVFCFNLPGYGFIRLSDISPSLVFHSSPSVKYSVFWTPTQVTNTSAVVSATLTNVGLFINMLNAMGHISSGHQSDLNTTV